MVKFSATFYVIAVANIYLCYYFLYFFSEFLKIFDKISKNILVLGSNAGESCYCLVGLLELLYI